MLDMVDVEYIRKLKLVQHWSIRQIASPLRVNMHETLDCMKFTEQGERGL